MNDKRKKTKGTKIIPEIEKGLNFKQNKEFSSETNFLPRLECAATSRLSSGEEIRSIVSRKEQKQEISTKIELPLIHESKQAISLDEEEKRVQKNIAFRRESVVRNKRPYEKLNLEEIKLQNELREFHNKHVKDVQMICNKYEIKTPERHQHEHQSDNEVEQLELELKEINEKLKGIFEAITKSEKIVETSILSKIIFESEEEVLRNSNDELSEINNPSKELKLAHRNDESNDSDSLSMKKIELSYAKVMFNIKNKQEILKKRLHFEFDRKPLSRLLSNKPIRAINEKMIPLTNRMNLEPNKIEEIEDEEKKYKEKKDFDVDPAKIFVNVELERLLFE